MADFVTLLSGDVMGVPLPENVRIRIEAQNSKKAIKAFKSVQAKREAAEVARREQEKIDREYAKAADLIGQQFSPGTEAAKSFAWLAAEESPGKLVVEVIQSAFRRDGTQLNWQEASKLVNDYLKSQNLAHYDRRRVLLSASPGNGSCIARAASRTHSGSLQQGHADKRKGRRAGSYRTSGAVESRDCAMESGIASSQNPRSISRDEARRMIRA